MSSSNGKVIRVGRKGMATFAFGMEEDPLKGQPFTIDVVDTLNRWWEIQRGFQDETGGVPPDQREACNVAMANFVSQLSSIPLEGEGRLTMAEVLEFMNVKIQEEWDRLADFFVPKSCDLFGVTPFEEEVLSAELPALFAWKQLHDPKYVGTLDTEAFLKLMQTAGYPEEVCQKEAEEWAVQRQRNDLPA